MRCREESYADPGTGPDQQEKESVVVFFSAHHPGYCSDLDDASARMSGLVQAHFNSK